MMLEIEPRTLHIVGKHLISKLDLQPLSLFSNYKKKKKRFYF